MKITNKILCHRVRGNLSKAKYLDICGLGIGAVEGLESCPILESLDMSRNCLEEFENFECCKNLWRINLANNQMRCLTGFSQLFAIGTLDLSNNFLTWNELARLRHIHILDLRLHANEDLEKDTYYRLHVIDCLPLVWMLDGRLITSAERLQVSQFYHDSALSNRPVRHKLNDKSILNSRTEQCGHIHGIRTCHFTANFPINEPHNSNTDKRRLEFLAENLQEDIKIKEHSFKRAVRRCLSENALKQILQLRHEDKEKCNMLLLLLVASLEFNLPEMLIEQTLDVASLNPMFNVDIRQLFTLDPASRTEVVSLLVSACKLERDVEKPTSSNFTSGGLYDRLYLCLYHSVLHLVRKVSRDHRKKNRLSSWHKIPDKNQFKRPQTAPASYRHSSASRFYLSPKVSKLEWKAHQGLLASELVLLLSVVPSFYHLIAQSNNSVCDILRVATGDNRLAPKLAQLSRELALHGGDVDLLYREICKSVITRIELAAINSSKTRNSFVGTESDSEYQALEVGQISSNTTQARFILNTSSAYPRRPKSAILRSGEHLTSGRSRQMSAITTSRQTQHIELGSRILLGAQNSAKVIALPEPHVALVQMDGVPAANGSITVQVRDLEKHYCYVDVSKLEYDRRIGSWKPQGAVGDRITLHSKSTIDITDSSSDETLQTTPSNYSTARQAIGYTPDKIPKLDGAVALVAIPSTASSFRSPHGERKKREVSPPRTAGCPTSGSIMLMTDDTSHNKLFTSQDQLHLVAESKPQRPLSALFCEKMDLSLSKAAFQAEMLSSESIDMREADKEPGQKTFLTESLRHEDDMVIGEDASYGEGFQHRVYHGIPSHLFHDQHYQNATVLDEGWDKLHPNSLDGDMESLTRDMEVATERKREEDKNQPPDEQLPDIESLLPDQQNRDERAVAQAIYSSPPLVSIPMPSLDTASIDENDPNRGGTNCDDESNPGLQVNAGSDETKVETRARDVEVDEEDESTLDIGNDLHKEFQNQHESTEEKQIVDSAVENGQESGGKTLENLQAEHNVRRRVQSARIPKHIKPEQEKSRPLSAVVNRQKHVMFHEGVDERDDSRPGSASSFQLRRTEAWRSSASSGSVGFVDIVNDPDEMTPHVGFVVDKKATKSKMKAVKFRRGMRRPPPQRPTSPDQLSIDLKRSVSPLFPTSPLISNRKLDVDKINSSRKNVTSPDTARSRVLKGSTHLASNWLADGRNIHQENFESRQLITSPRLPGYLEGVGLLPQKVNKPQTPKSVTPTSDVALHNLPSRPVKPFSRLPHTCYRRSHETGQNVQASSLGGSLVWNRPRFSTLDQVKQLSGKLHSRQGVQSPSTKRL
ncbi:unnamed protein product [Clavelina lepadiformis]|uniref:Uncharacterized protein n=1 Tax=Clavelina lepadiformis TaxID=159417 RepID=A0ABP0FPY3_CLALP